MADNLIYYHDAIIYNGNLFTDKNIFKNISLIIHP